MSKAYGVTLNDLMVTLMSRALNSHMKRVKEDDKSKSMILMMAASTRRDYSISNQFNIFMVNQQVENSEFEAHLKDTKRQFDYFKNSTAIDYLAMMI